jgi:hypothetical protein
VRAAIATCHRVQRAVIDVVVAVNAGHWGSSSLMTARSSSSSSSHAESAHAVDAGALPLLCEAIGPPLCVACWDDSQNTLRPC